MPSEVLVCFQVVSVLSVSQNGIVLLPQFSHNRPFEGGVLTVMMGEVLVSAVLLFFIGVDVEGPATPLQSNSVSATLSQLLSDIVDLSLGPGARTLHFFGRPPLHCVSKWLHAVH